MIDFLDEAIKIKKELINIRRDIHEYPELGFEEKRTSRLIKSFLAKEGIKYTEVASTGVCGIIYGTGEGDSSKVIGVRADMDALPIQEKNGVPYASKVKEKMHACGHDAHTAILLGVARIINNNKEKFAGVVKLFFEPAEETTGGAPIMINEGVLENPNVDVVIGLHVTEDLECGKIKIKKNMVHAASNPFKIKVKGSGGHGAAPSTTIDPIVIASNIIMSAQTIISREIAPVNPAVITFGSIHGGTAQNIIPEEVEMRGIIRTTTPEDRIKVVNRFEALVKGIANSMRGNAEVEIEESYPCLFNNDEMVDRAIKVATNIIGKENVKEKKETSLGVESFAYFANERPSVFYFLGTGNKEKKTNMPAHSSYFNIDEDAIPIGVAIQCGIIFDYLTI